MKNGENVLSKEVNTKYQGTKVIDVILPRKARHILNSKYLYPKPTQVGR
jgi:hypothetical protein